MGFAAFKSFACRLADVVVIGRHDELLVKDVRDALRVAGWDKTQADGRLRGRWQLV